MTKEERRKVVLDFMADHPLAYPPRVLYRNLKLLEGITFQWRSIQTYLEEFEEEGLVMRVEKDALEEGEVIEAGEDARAYYIITDKGREYIRD